MSLVSADVVFPRTIELMSDLSVDLLRVVPPVPVIALASKTGLGKDMLLWDIGPRELVRVDESDLPY